MEMISFQADVSQPGVKLFKINPKTSFFFLTISWTSVILNLTLPFLGVGGNFQSFTMN